MILQVTLGPLTSVMTTTDLRYPTSSLQRAAYQQDLASWLWSEFTPEKNPPSNGKNFTPTKKGPKKVKSQDSWAQFPISHLGGHRSCYKILKWLLRVCIFRILGTTDSISSGLEDPSPVAMPLFVCLSCRRKTHGKTNVPKLQDSDDFCLCEYLPHTSRAAR